MTGRRPRRSLVLLFLAALGAAWMPAASCRPHQASPAAGAAAPPPHPRPAQNPPAAASAPLHERMLSLPAEPHTPHHLGPGEIDSYAIDLTAGTYLSATFEQLNLDVYVDVAPPGQGPLYRVDSPYGPHGCEEVHLVARITGRYRLKVGALVASPQGSYVPRLVAVRRPAAADRAWAEAQMAFYAAKALDDHVAARTFPETAAKYELARRLFQQAGDRRGQAYSLFRLAKVEAGQGQTAAGLAAFTAARRLYRGLHDGYFVAYADDEIGSCRTELGDFGAAEASFRRAVAAWRRRAEVREEAATSHNLGKLHQLLGHSFQALAWFRRALTLWQRAGDAGAGQATTLTGIGWVYTSVGDWQHALDAHWRALRLRNARREPLARAISLTQIGSVFLAAGDARQALAYLELAWALQSQRAASSDQAVTLDAIGLSLRAQGRYDEARAPYLRALRLYGSPPDLHGQAATWVNLGMLSVWQRQPGQALASFENALRLARDTHDPATEGRTLLGMAAAERERGNAAVAEDRAEAALEKIESLRVHAARPEAQTTYLAANLNVYDLLVAIEMERHHDLPAGGFDLRALATSERSRARVLLDALSDGHRLHGSSRARPGQATRPRRQLDLGAPSSAPASSAQPPDLELLRRRLLTGNTLLLEYRLAEPHSYLWAVASDSLHSFELPGRRTLEPLLRSAYEQMARAPRGPARPSAESDALALSRELLAPAASLLATRRLLIAGQGLLQYLPFSALPDPADPSRPLAASHEIVSIPSLAVLAQLRDRAAARRPAPHLVAILADPVFDWEDPRLPRAARPPSFPELGDLFLPRLLHSRAEAKGIAALVPRGELYQALDFAASRDLVTGGRLARYRIVHFASHGILRADDAALSALVLSRWDPSGRPRDGYLRVHDIEALDLPADLVVLSACQTALGQPFAGEGLVGLPQAFFAAGARRVLVSLWEVGDESTARLMALFYRGLLQDHLPPATALRAAQLALRAEPRWAAPHHWAGFVLQGDWP